MPDLGEPSSYLNLGKGAEVYSCDGERVGEVEHVLAAEDADIFDGFVLDTSVLPGGHRFVDADQVEEIFERGVLLKLYRQEAERLPEPSANPATLEATPDDVAEDDESNLKRKLRRAWDLISGKT
ncbi:MAG TPA: PRC-barrel domain-containing protein [Solirubrobacterales bacterium]|nr:PRC-barrel domain-containing protein [Solirubrobacterales bacterium]